MTTRWARSISPRWRKRRSSPSIRWTPIRLYLLIWREIRDGAAACPAVCDRLAGAAAVWSRPWSCAAVLFVAVSLL